PHAAAEALVDIAVQRLPIERALVAEGVVNARACDAHAHGKVAYGRPVVAVDPEALDGGIEHSRLVEFPRPGHSRLSATSREEVAVLTPTMHFRTTDIKRQRKSADKARRRRRRLVPERLERTMTAQLRSCDGRSAISSATWLSHMAQRMERCAGI